MPALHSVRAWYTQLVSNGVALPQNLPDMMDIEVSPASGEWRVAGSQGAWMSITEDPGSLLDARAAIKPEPQLGSDAPAQGAAGT